ncbi:hypothetical protein OG772_20635 [Streptomyces sp. NBC_01321]|uniref:hypothetical protein n=1 Tax=Streptomyces sp. NBC_01321 TaxID=2903825 RepID=UPI002E10676F|nr:hypothetical protein OG772_20635 [Streptomyces sp. NBC_01321]
MQIAQGIDWGTVPAWFSAVLSGGSVLLAFYIILRDRKKAEQADAMKVICWVHREEGRVIRVINASDRSIHYVRGFDLIAHREAHFATYFIADHVLPGEEVTKESESGIDPEKQDWMPWAVEFRDSDGKAWVRDMHSGRLAEVRPRLSYRLTLRYWATRWYSHKALRKLSR